MNQMIMTLNLADESILLNKGVLEALDWPRQIQLLINKEEKMLLLRACTMEDTQAVVVPEEPEASFEISARAFLKRIRQLVGWADKQPRLCYGEYLPAKIPREPERSVGFTMSGYFS